MGEFVGIDPRGAHEVIRRMEAGKEALDRLRPLLDAAIAEAGKDWAGDPGSAALHRARAFLDASGQELRWRIDTLERLVPVRERGMLSGTFPFPSEREAVETAEQDARAILHALTDHDRHPSTAARHSLESAVAALTPGDPAYASALLTTLGPTTLIRLLGADARSDREIFPVPTDLDSTDTTAPADPRPPGLGNTGTDGPGGRLAALFADAERTGRLGQEWDGLVGGAPVSVPAALVTLGRPSSLFLNRVAVALLDREPPDPRPLVLAYGAFPEAFQQLLAEHPRETDLLLAAAGDDEALATALHGALRPYAGADGLRERAWLNVVRAVGAHDDAPGAAVRLVLAEDVTPYLGRLAQARDGAQPAPPWDRLDAETAARFLGALRLRSH